MTSDMTQLREHVETTFNGKYAVWPGGYPGKIELCLIDAVLSIRARYGSPTSGVRRRVALWSANSDAGNLDDLTRIAALEPGALATRIDNNQKLTGGLIKAQAMVQAAKNLVDAGAATSTEVPA